ncbi:MAG: DUF1093 domain-containing protein [Schleiferilactobacillus perolens]|uniref:DUF1093 domain-containing protein n=1 Tax=Schleiferilactobacillus perolens TaxID=100468 RepID=UPI0039E894B5
MKKILGVILVILIGVGGFYSYQYWNKTYNAKTAYAIAPAVPKKTETVDMDGKKVVEDGQQLYSYDYNIQFVREDGSKVTIPVEISNKDPKPLTPGTYLKAKVSQTRATEGPNPVSSASAVPANVCRILQSK